MNSYPQNRKFSFELAGKAMEVTIQLDPAVVKRYELAPHSYSYQGRLPKDWRNDYYKMFLQHPDDKQLVTGILQALRNQKPGASEDELAEMVIALVQGSITYDWETFHNIDQSKIRYPYETLWNGTGVCADKSILLARLLGDIGYGLAIMTYERANHMAIGLKVPREYGNYRTDYAFVESTAYTPIGHIPDKYVGGIRLDGRPQLIELPGHKVFQKIAQNRQAEKEMTTQFGKDYLQMSGQQRGLKEQMTKLEADLKESKKALRGCSGTLPPAKFQECQRLNQEHNKKVEQFNRLVAEFNAKSGQS